MLEAIRNLGGLKIIQEFPEWKISKGNKKIGACDKKLASNNKKKDVKQKTLMR